MTFPAKNLPQDVKDFLELLKNQPESDWVKRGEEQALNLFKEMSARVPAYREFLKKNNFNADSVKNIGDFKNIPVTNKENYLLSYPLESLCWDGRLQGEKWTIASTSGSTGEPFYFPRTKFQDEQFRLTAEAVFLDFFEIDEKTTLFVDCFALGVWIGGMFMYQAVKYLIDSDKYPLSIITPGADKTETIKAVKNLAGKFDQVILGGYAPLVKDLIDLGTGQGVEWNKYNMRYFFAAEGFTEGYRDYILRHGGAKNAFTDTINHYGTADLGTMAHETPLTILMRRQAVKQEGLAQALFENPHKQPTLTQYVPELYYFERIGNRLACSAAGGFPLVRYDLKDRGGVLTIKQVRDAFAANGLDLDEEIKKQGLEGKIWNLPFVYLFERDDLTASIYSVNIYPESIHKALQKPEFEKRITGKFTMLVDYNQDQNQELQINIELKEGQTHDSALEEQLSGSIVASLIKENSEWRDFYADETIRHKVIPKLVFWPYGDDLHFRSGGKQKWVKKKK